MKNKGIIILLIALGALIIVIIAWDFISKRPDKSAENPYELNIDEYVQVDDSALVQYNEIRNISLDSVPHHAIAYADNKIYILGNEFLQVITPEGTELMRKKLMDSPRCMTVSGNIIYIGYTDHIASYNSKGELLASWDTLGTQAVLTSLAVKDDFLFAADAGNRRVIRYKISGERLGEFEGKSDTGQIHGFIIPSPYFDLAINSYGELWVVNPGKHALEQYSYDGKLIGFWENASFNLEGFSGCCNPAQIAFLPDGSFVTSEKGLVRIKVHKASGELICVVAPPENFGEAFLAPDIAVTPEGIIYALDFDNKMIRVFQHK
jgi:hypothetical protein